MENGERRSQRRAASTAENFLSSAALGQFVTLLKPTILWGPSNMFDVSALWTPLSSDQISNSIRRSHLFPDRLSLAEWNSLRLRFEHHVRFAVFRKNETKERAKKEQKSFGFYREKNCYAKIRTAYCVGIELS